MDVTLNLPPELYDLAQQLADAKSEQLEILLVSQLQQALHDPFVTLALDEQNELRALAYLSDAALWTIAREKMPQTQQDRLQFFMDKNNLGELTPDEQTEFNALVEQGQKLTLRKAQAGVLLKERGYIISLASFNE
jgi:hypothetical protein